MRANEEEGREEKEVNYQGRKFRVKEGRWKEGAPLRSFLNSGADFLSLSSVAWKREADLGLDAPHEGIKPLRET